MTSLFSLGSVVITSNALASLNAEDVRASVHRHASGDWGDLCAADRASNERALLGEGRLFSVYHDRERRKLYVITEHDRSVTTVLLPEDY